MSTETLLCGASLVQRRQTDKEYEAERSLRNAASVRVLANSAGPCSSPVARRVHKRPANSPLQSGLVLDVCAAKNGDGSARFPNLAKHAPRVLLLTPGPLITVEQPVAVRSAGGGADEKPPLPASQSPANADAEKNTQQLDPPRSGSASAAAAALAPPAAELAAFPTDAAELGSADFELFCKEQLLGALAGEAEVPLHELRASELHQAADFLSTQEFALTARRDACALAPYAVAVDLTGQEVDIFSLPEDICAELSQGPFAALATRLLDDVSLQKTGFRAADALDLRFVYNRRAPLEVPGITLVIGLVRPEARRRVRLLRLGAASCFYSAMRRATTRMATTRLLQRTVAQLTGHALVLRYIAPYAPLGATDAVEARIAAGIKRDVKQHVFADTAPGDARGPLTPAEPAVAYVVMRFQQRLAPEVLDAAQDIVLRCLSGTPAEDIQPRQRPYRVCVQSQDELPAAMALMAAPSSAQGALDADVLCLYGHGAPQKKWSSPTCDLPSCTTSVLVKELELCKGALRWLLEQPVAMVAAHAGLAMVKALVYDGIAPASLARLAWLSPPRQRQRHTWLAPLQAAFAQGA